MDTIAHGIWGYILAKLIGIKQKINPFATAFWGMFPDLFSFFLFTLWAFSAYGFSNLHPPHSLADATPETASLIGLTDMLYNASHSIFIFAIVFIVVSLLYRKPIWELTGWLLHIILDIPTHTLDFYPTLFLWPVSDWKLNGIIGRTSWFMIINYGLMFSILLFIHRKDLIKIIKKVTKL